MFGAEDFSRVVSEEDWRAIAVMGSGGKTTLLGSFAKVLAKTNRRVLISTLTKVYPFPGVTCVDSPEALPDAFSRERVVFLGRQLGTEGKLAGVPFLSLNELLDLADVVLLETDGARGRPFKVHLPHDPVVPREIAKTFIVAGASAIGAPVGTETVHRFERAPGHWNLRAGEVLDSDTAARILLAPDGYLGQAPGQMPTLFINQADAYPQEAELLAAAVGRRWPGGILVGSARTGDNECLDNPGPRTPLLVLAAGASRRFGEDKRRFRLKGHPLFEWTLAAYAGVRVLEKIVVLAREDDELGRLAMRYGFRPVICSDPEAGMSASLRAGMAAIPAQADSVLVALGDMPAVKAETVDALLVAARSRPDRALRPVHRGQPGHPVLLPRSSFDDLSSLSGDRGARELLPALDPFHLESEDAGVILDLNRVEDLPELENRLAEEPSPHAF